MRPNKIKDEAVLACLRGGRYRVDRDGTVWSCRSARKERRLRPSRLSSGYFLLNLRGLDEESLMVYLHRLVALAHLPNPDDLPEVNHKNLCKDDCRADNLEWISSSENTLHAIANGARPRGRGGKGFCREIR